MGATTKEQGVKIEMQDDTRNDLKRELQQERENRKRQRYPGTHMVTGRFSGSSSLTALVSQR